MWTSSKPIGLRPRDGVRSASPHVGNESRRLGRIRTGYLETKMSNSDPAFAKGQLVNVDDPVITVESVCFSAL